MSTHMTGPQHYREAERLVRRGFDSDLAAAQVHATLAAAAGAVAVATARGPGDVSQEWIDAVYPSSVSSGNEGEDE